MRERKTQRDRQGGREREREREREFILSQFPIEVAVSDLFMYRSAST